MAENSNMSDVPLKRALPRKSAFSCEACRKRKVSFRSRTGSEMAWKWIAECPESVLRLTGEPFDRSSVTEPARHAHAVLHEARHACTACKAIVLSIDSRDQAESDTKSALLILSVVSVPSLTVSFSRFALIEPQRCLTPSSLRLGLPSWNRLFPEPGVSVRIPTHPRQAHQSRWRNLARVPATGSNSKTMIHRSYQGNSKA